jgi:hypothetical protein
VLVKRILGLEAALGLAALLASSPARADGPADRDACRTAYSQAQTLRDAHKLVDARAQLRTCAQATCASFILKDCTGWLLDIDGRVPSVVLIAKDAAGASLTDVSVTIDGKPLTARLDGTAVDVDPGAHEFVFTLQDGTKTQKSIVVAEGQKAQAVAVAFAGVGAPPTPGAVMPPEAQQPASDNASPASGFWTTRHKAGAGVTAAGAVGVIVGGIFGGLTASESSQQNKDCSGATLSLCPNHAAALSDHSSAVTDGAASTAAFIVGGILAAAGITLLVTGRTAEAPGAVVVTPSVGKSGGGLLLGAQF